MHVRAGLGGARVPMRASSSGRATGRLPIGPADGRPSATATMKQQACGSWTPPSKAALQQQRTSSTVALIMCPSYTCRGRLMLCMRSSASSACGQDRRTRETSEGEAAAEGGSTGGRQCKQELAR